MTRWQPNATVEIARTRATMLRQARKFFTDNNVLEVDTPSLAANATMDANIASIPATVAGRETFLITSPEYYMKRLLAAGYPDIYQIGQAFRDAESGQHHLPEFTLIEWYRRAFNLQAIIDDSVRFITLMLDEGLQEAHTDSLTYDSFTYAGAFQRSLGIDPLHTTIGAIAAAIDADDDLAGTLGDSLDTWLDFAMAVQVADDFSDDRLTVIHHYPISQASLARQCPGNHALADRFEIYYGKLELANGFVELLDEDTQRERFAIDQAKRKRGDLPVHKIDEKLIAALRAGLPPCAGVAVGLERLLAIRTRSTHINDVVSFTPGL